MQAGVTFSELSQRSGIAEDDLGRLLDGRADFTVVDLVEIAAVLGVTVTALLPASAADDE